MRVNVTPRCSTYGHEPSRHFRREFKRHHHALTLMPDLSQSRTHDVSLAVLEVARLPHPAEWATSPVLNRVIAFYFNRREIPCT